MRPVNAAKSCTYCGDIGADRDHIIPASWRGRRLYTDKTTPSCKDCNTRILRDRPIFTIQERGLCVLQTLRKRLNKLHCPEWRTDELADLGPVLRSSVKGLLLQKERLLIRIGFCAAVYDPESLPRWEDDLETRMK